jgi:tetratricopeptide (TPR) repeat protein
LAVDIFLFFEGERTMMKKNVFFGLTGAVMAAVMVMAALCFTGCATTKEKVVEKAVEKVDEKVDEKVREEAYKKIAEYTMAIEENPDNKEAYNYRGWAYLKAGDSALAANDFNEALRIDPSYRSAKYGLRHVRVPHAAYLLFVEGSDAMVAGNLDLAIEKYTRAIALVPDYSSAYNARGLMYLSRSMYDRAEAEFKKVVEIDPEFADGYLNRGRIYLYKRMYDKAEADFKKAVKIDPEFADGYAYLGEVYMHGLRWDKDYDKAEQYLNQALKIDPTIRFAKSSLKFITDMREKQESSGVNFDFAIVEEDGKQTVTILGYKGQRMEVHIPNYINGIPVTSIKMMAFNLKPLTKLKLPATLIEIGPFAFFGNSLTSIVIPDSVREIGSSAFEQISGEITDITIGSDVNVFRDAFGTLNSFAKIYNAMGKKAGRYRGTTYTYSSN